MMTTTKKSNLQFLISLSLGLMVLVGLPVVYMWWMTPVGQVFTGVSPYSPIDLPVYFADIQQVIQGQLLVHDLFSTEGPQRGMFHVLWVVLGLFARWLRLDPWVVFHAARILLIPVLVWALWWGVKQFLPQHMWRLGVVMTIFASGTGFLLGHFVEGHELSQIGLDQWVPEGFVFHATLQSPHYIFAYSLLILVLASWFQATRATTTRRWRWVLVSGLLASVLFSFHPFHIFTIGLILLTHSLVLVMYDHQQYKHLWWVLPVWILAALPGASYQIWLQWGDAVLRARSFQSKTLTPSFASAYLSLTALWTFALVGVRRLWREHREAALFLLIWGAVQTAALFAPIQVNRRFIMGLQVDLALLATAGWWFIFREWKLKSIFSRWVHLVWSGWQLSVGLLVLVVVFWFSSISAFINYLRAPVQIADLLYMSSAQDNAYEWIKNNTSESATVLALSWPANLLPGETGRATYVGHWHETIDWENKVRLAQVIFFSTNPQQVQRELKKIAVSFVLIQPTLPFTPPAASRVVFEQDNWRVFELDF